MKIVKSALYMGLVAISLASCSKENDQDADFDSANSEEVALALDFDAELDQLGEMSLEGNPEKKSTVANCLNFQIDTTGNPNVITLDWGPVNCQGADGKYRRGKVVITYNDEPFAVGAVRSMTLDGFAVNDFEINGTRSVTFKGMNGKQQPYSEVASNLTITRPDSAVIKWNSSRQRTWVEGFNNLDPFDNVVEVTGIANGETAAGVVYNMSILQPLRAEATCSNLVSGSIAVAGPSFSTRTLDYGNGNCDNVATISVNGKSKTIKLK